MLFAQLQNLASHLGFICVSESMDGSPTGFEEEEQDDWLPPGKEDEADWLPPEKPVPKESVSESTHNDFVGLIKGSARGVTDSGAQQPVVGASAAQRWCDRLRKRHGLVPVDVTPHNMDRDLCCRIGPAKVVRVLGIVGVNGVVRFLVLEEPVSTDGRQQFTPPLTPVPLVRQLGANIC